MKIFLRGRNGGLFPTDRMSADRCAKLSGKDVECEPKQARNIQHHKKFWALCGLCAEQSDYTAQQVCDIFKLRAGLTTQSQLPDGTIVQHPGSISFANMDQIAFEEFYERVMGVVVEDILPGVDREDLKRELEAFTRPNY